MALIDRVKERIETDLSDAELQAMVDEVTAEIDRRFGVNGQITIFLDGDRELARNRGFLTVIRPIDTALTVTAVELDPPSTGNVAAETTLAADDFRVLHGGRTIERLSGGTNGALRWAPVVELTYTPVSDAKQREEATIEILQLEIEARGLDSERAGDWQAAYPNLAARRETILSRLAPRRGLQLA